MNRSAIPTIGVFRLPDKHQNFVYVIVLFASPESQSNHLVLLKTGLNI
jgi:hypothetical protein